MKIENRIDRAIVTGLLTVLVLAGFFWPFVVLLVARTNPFLFSWGVWLKLASEPLDKACVDAAFVMMFMWSCTGLAFFTCWGLHGLMRAIWSFVGGERWGL
jgi:hypothetical protein